MSALLSLQIYHDPFPLCRSLYHVFNLILYIHDIFIIHSQCSSYLPPSLSIRTFCSFASSPFHSYRGALQNRCSLLATSTAEAEGVYVCTSESLFVWVCGSACSPWCLLLDDLEFDCCLISCMAVLTDRNKDMVDYYAKIGSNHRPRSAMPLSLNTQVRPQRLRTGCLGTEVQLLTLCCRFDELKVVHWHDCSIYKTLFCVYTWALKC